jgi:hypothetical protein
MYTSVMLIALSGCLSDVAALPSSSPWHTEYSVAWSKGHAEKKPLALIFGSGAGGWEKLSKEGEMGKEAKHLLESEYVCAYIDTSKPVGSQLATAYEIAGGSGIVISDKTGDLQAFRHEGELANSDLERYLRKYADPQRVVMATDSNPTEVRTSYYPPVQASMPYYQPSYIPFRSGGCPNCR